MRDQAAGEMCPSEECNGPGQPRPTSCAKCSRPRSAPGTSGSQDGVGTMGSFPWDRYLTQVSSVMPQVVRERCPYCRGEAGPSDMSSPLQEYKVETENLRPSCQYDGWRTQDPGYPPGCSYSLRTAQDGLGMARLETQG